MITRRSILAAVMSAPAAMRALGVRAELQSKQLPGKIAFVRNGSIWQWAAGDASELLKADNISDPRWSPDGTSLIYVRSGNSFSDLYTFDTTTGIENALTNNQSQFDVGSIEYAAGSSWVLDPDWSKSGLIAFATDMAGQNAPLALWLMTNIDEQPYQALDPQTEEDIAEISLSSDGSFASYTVRVRQGDGSSGTYIAVRDLNSGVAGPIADSSGDQFDSAISPDQQWIAMAIRDPNGTTDLWIVERAPGDRSRMTRNENAMAPRWSADGQYLGYIREADFKFQLWAARIANGKISDPTNIYDDDGIDSRSGVSWWVGTGLLTPTPTQAG